MQLCNTLHYNTCKSHHHSTPLLFSLSGAISLVVFPLVSIEQQAQKVCQDWSIPYLSLDETKPEDIASVLEAMEPKPRVITATITKVSIVEVQRALRRLPIATICVDEAQVL